MIIENVRGLVWDLDGTLIDSFGIYEKVVADIVADHGYTMPTRDYMLKHYHGTLDEALKQALGIDSEAELERIVSTFVEKQNVFYSGDLGTHLFQDAEKLAGQAAKLGLPQLLVTNRAHAGRGNASPKFIVAATVLANFIHDVNTSDEVEYRKPDKRALGDWLERHQLSPEEILVIGDQFVDAQLALNLGARAVLIDRNGGIPHLGELSEKDHKDIVVVKDLGVIELSGAASAKI